jgi:galactoside O-acetyltransferase
MTTHFGDRLQAAMSVVREMTGRERDRRRLLASGDGVQIGRNVDVRSPDRLVLGSETMVDVGVVLHCGGMGWSPNDGGITVGSHCYIGPNSVLFGGAGIEIGDSVLISPGVVITSHQHSYDRVGVDIRLQSLRFGRVVIERDVWIGANATVLPGVRIGRGSIVGAGAVVTRDVAPGTVVMGVPARVAHER